MTTPPTSAGWYRDPDGSGGQRYWDGSGWTEHWSPATPEPTEERVGAHRAREPEPESEPGPPPVDPSYGEQPPYGAQPAPHDPRRQLITRFGAACAALLAVLVVVLIYALFIHQDNTIQAASGPAPTASPSDGWAGTPSPTATESPTTASGSGPRGTDAGVTFAVTGMDTAPSVKSQDAPVEQTAQGEYFIVHLNLTNSGDQPAAFVGTFQKLKAGGDTYSIDEVATAYLNGTAAQLNPGDTADVAIAFDVPPGTTPDSLEAHGDPASAGVDVPLS